MIMKKFILGTVLTLLMVSSVYAASQNPNEVAYRNSDESNTKVKNLYENLRENFRTDGGFNYYLKNRFKNYEVSRIAAVQVMYPLTGRALKAYNNMHVLLTSNAAIRLNNVEIDELRHVVDEYCKYNAFKFEYKDPQACSEARINSIFNN